MDKPLTNENLDSLIMFIVKGADDKEKVWYTPFL